MSITVEGAGVAVMGRVERRRDEDAGTLHVDIAISELAFEALMGEGAASAAPAGIKAESALRCYLGDKGSDRAAWPYPSFLRGSETAGTVRIELDVAADLWRAFEAEAAAQGVSVEQLSEHAAFYFGAERDAGRLTERILRDLSASAEDQPA